MILYDVSLTSSLHCKNCLFPCKLGQCWLHKQESFFSFSFFYFTHVTVGEEKTPEEVKHDLGLSVWVSWQVSLLLVPASACVLSHMFPLCTHSHTLTVHPDDWAVTLTLSVTCCSRASGGFLCQTSPLLGSKTAELFQITYSLTTGFNKYSAFCCYWPGDPGCCALYSPSFLSG